MVLPMFKKTEKEIMSKWLSPKDNPIVSVACLTYNHEKYLRDALDSFLMQETEFSFEIIVYDDASTDQNTQIIMEYVHRYPNIIKPIIQTVNQYSIHKRISIDFIFNEVQGKYIAFCEGDDYWTDKSKLQKQYNALEQNEELNLCLHWADLLDEPTGRKTGIIGNYPVVPDFPIISFSDIVKKPYGQIPTASTFIRATVLPDLSKFFTESKASIFDIFLHMMAARGLGAYLIPESMSVYRVNVPGSWNDSLTKGKLNNHVFKRVEAFKVLEKYVGKNEVEILREASFNSFLFILRIPYASRATKLKVLDTIGKDLSLYQRVYFKVITELNLIHRIFAKLIG